MEDNSNDDYNQYYFNENEDLEDDFNDYMNNENIKFKETIVYLDDSLLYIINNMEINVIHGSIKVNILENLHMLQKGYTTIENLTMICDIYYHLYDVYIYTDKLYKNIDYSINSSVYEILLESDLIEKLYKNYKKFDLDIYGNIKLQSFEYNMNTILTYDWIQLILYSKLTLYAAIILEYEYMIEEILDSVDPRDDDNEAYHLAVKVGDKEIISLIKSKIIKLNWLDKEVLSQEFGKYNFLYDDIIKYYQSRKY